MKHYARLADLQPLVGTEIAVSDWMLVDQKQINLFADATGDHAWLHVDPERAAAGPFGAPIAHGFLTLSLLPAMIGSAMAIDDVVAIVNYGLNRVRFTTPVPVDSRLRARMVLKAMETLPARAGRSGWQLTWDVAVERENTDRRVCVAEFIVLYYL